MWRLLRAILQRGRPAEPLLSRAEAPLRAVAQQWVWRTNPAPKRWPEPALLHLGCGDHVLPDFVNVDFLPHTGDVLQWNFLDRWPDAAEGRIAAGFSEDVIEHFFFEEQVYLLAEMNRALVKDGIFRVLMPNLGSLLRVGKGFEGGPERDGFLARWYGVGTGSDVINLGMRFGGHRWLHDEISFRRMAALCGFAAQRTSCAESGDPRLSGHNLRDETNSLSFAMDLRKCASIERIVLEPERVVGAIQEGELTPGQPLYVATGNDPQVHYRVPIEFPLAHLVVVALRGANLSQFQEHNYAELYFSDSADEVLPLDASMASVANARFVAAPLIATRLRDRSVCTLRYDPARKAGDYFSVGPVELFVTTSDWKQRISEIEAGGAGVGR
jgi:predicted SAM-dependent methyltransferase